MSGHSIYSYLRNGRRFLEVGQDDVQLLLPDSGMQGIGTRGLNGCSCVVIIGTAVIMAHVSPLPGSSQQRARDTPDVRDQLSRAHHDRFLQRVARLLGGNASHFPSSGTSWGIFSYGPGSSPPVQAIMVQVQAHLAGMGFPMRPAFYESVAAGSVTGSKGELVATRRLTGEISLYLEDRQLWPEPSSTQRQATSSTAAAAARGAPAASSSNTSGNIADPAIARVTRC